jgi:hypothetical protein
MGRTYGQVISGVNSEGAELHAGVFNENAVRAAAGLTMAIGAVAFVYAYFQHRYLGLQTAATFFFVEFSIRVIFGLQYSPTGIVSRFLALRKPPEWVSAKPKRFAWTLGMVLAGAMTIITNSHVRGWLPRSICLVCITLMWLESVLGLCIGCEIHGFLVRRGWAQKDEAYEICAGGACEIPVAPARTAEYARG